MSELLVTERRDERDKIVAWREHVLLEADVPVERARAVADNLALDLHQFVDRFKTLTIDGACSPQLAVEILA